MTEFPLIGGQVALSNGATQSTDSFVNGIRMNTGGAALASTSAPSTISNGLPFTSAGVLSYVDASAGLPAGTTWTNGIPLSSAGSICVSPTAPTTWSNGIPFDLNGAVSALVSSLELNFLQGSLDARVTFARADATTCATYFDATGKLATAAANIPRFDYDPVTLLPRGLLIEESRQNLLLQSRDMTQAAWTKTDVTPARTQVGLDGVANTACLMTEGSAGTAATVQSATVAAGSTITASIVLKRGNTDWVRLTAGGPSLTNGADAWFNLNTGAKGSVSARGTGTSNSSTITSLGGGWYRCAVTTLPDGAYTSATMQIASASADASTSRVSGATYIVDAAQLESGSWASSIIPTTTTALTRAADSASMASTNFSSWFSATEGTFVAEADFNTVSIATSSGVVGTGASARFMYRTASEGKLKTYDGTTITATGNATTAGAVFKSAVSYTAGVSKSLVLNGGTVVDDPTCPAPYTAGTALYIGDYNAGAYLNGHIRSLRFYPKRLSNSQIQALTS